MPVRLPSFVESSRRSLTPFLFIPKLRRVHVLSLLPPFFLSLCASQHIRQYGFIWACNPKQALNVASATATSYGIIPRVLRKRSKAAGEKRNTNSRQESRIQLSVRGQAPDGPQRDEPFSSFRSPPCLFTSPIPSSQFLFPQHRANCRVDLIVHGLTVLLPPRTARTKRLQCASNLRAEIALACLDAVMNPQF